MTPAPLADPEAREFLRNADPVLARLIVARPDFRPPNRTSRRRVLRTNDCFGMLRSAGAGPQAGVAAGSESARRFAIRSISSRDCGPFFLSRCRKAPGYKAHTFPTWNGSQVPGGEVAHVGLSGLSVVTVDDGAREH